jgi:hypothetical protein
MKKKSYQPLGGSTHQRNVLSDERFSLPLAVDTPVDVARVNMFAQSEQTIAIDTAL